MFAPRDSDEYLLDSERRVIRVRLHWASLAWDIFETVALLAVAVMVSYLLPPSMWLVQNILWYAALFVLLVTTTLSVYKPWGLTPYGVRRQAEESGARIVNRRSRQAGRYILMGIAAVIALIVLLHLFGIGLHAH